MKRTLWRHKRRQLIDHPQRTADQDLLSGRDGFLQKGFQHMTARAVLRRINALSHSKVNSQLTSTYANVCHSHHFEVALSSGRITSKMGLKDCAVASQSCLGQAKMGATGALQDPSP